MFKNVLPLVQCFGRTNTDVIPKNWNSQNWKTLGTNCPLDGEAYIASSVPQDIGHPKLHSLFCRNHKKAPNYRWRSGFSGKRKTGRHQAAS